MVYIPLVILTSCHAPENVAIHVTKVNQVKMADLVINEANQMTIKACQNWVLSAQDIEQFFTQSESFLTPAYSEFYQLPCSIDGELRVGEDKWQFSLNGGGMATWQREDEIKYFGCKVDACHQWVLLPYDGMNPDN